MLLSESVCKKREYANRWGGLVSCVIKMDAKKCFVIFGRQLLLAPIGLVGSILWTFVFSCRVG